MSLLSLQNISFSYGKTPVLNDISYEFEKGKIYCIIGKSGAGKTTLLSLLSGLASPNSGDILYDGKSIAKIDKYTFRSKFIGVVFQSFNLITKYTALENVVLSMDVANYKTKNKKNRALELLNSVGLDEDVANRRVLKLSGGQQQRVAIARALSYDPDIILADEPTGNLDRDTQKEIMDIFRDLANNGKCVILVSHSPDVADMCDECYELTKLTAKDKKRIILGETK
ncbi:MAG: ABC transporter ATP-binding protein [Clostridia bacterium]|nr:ABC transporter ATP-binding protein [Clostridia bacterium]